MVVNIFLAPKSSRKYDEDFKRSVIKGIPREKIEKYLGDYKGKEECIKMWDNGITYKKMKEDDIVIFYSKGKYTHYGKISYVVTDSEHNEKISRIAWPRDYPVNIENKPFYIFFIKNLTEIPRSTKNLNSALGYKETTIVYGFRCVREDRVKNFIDKYGDIEKFLKINIPPTILPVKKQFIYCILLDKYEAKGAYRVKVGQTIRSCEERLRDFSTANPDAKIIVCWDISKDLNLNKVENFTLDYFGLRSHSRDRDVFVIGSLSLKKIISNLNVIFTAHYIIEEFRGI